ncbi:MAG: sel1 repeat family protein [Desulfovibrio sp.]|nr:sel1 repeat family protein [Desulfovibrio sp.]
MYDKGDGVPQDFAEARRWYGKAATQGYVWAQYYLGVMHEKGQGGPQDKRAAKEWFRKACDGGVQDCCSAYRRLNEAGF